MAGFGRYGDADYRERERGFDDDRDDPRGRGRGGFFGGRDWDDDDRRGYVGERRGTTEPRGRFGAGRDREEDRFGNDDSRRALPIDETGRLIASNKVEGTPVYGPDGERLGTAYNLMIDKFTGQVEYAVMRYGGFLGMRQRYYPLPWRILTYDPREGGYRIHMTHRDLERAPSFGREDEPRFSRDYGRRVNDWYGVDV